MKTVAGIKIGGIRTVFLLVLFSVMILAVSSCNKTDCADAKCLVIEPQFQDSLNTTGFPSVDSFDTYRLEDLTKYTNDTDFKDIMQETERFISSNAITSTEPDFNEDFLSLGESG